ncbi:FeoA family protein [Entomospira culicis]|uniref:Ferrous iron transport protein A n=1 Tax=Entomospira culicis TaxID=2719989 RepID=A0A968KU60_9SPIO|nr:FeoA family protein [Entomospira culicis]NIZ18969.1 ferrous iron transport protein A [Entomospira culicis]NIZ69184.1 ferrous iron transport protein A [Entomospira culicis]WDI37770.1 FeoA family protein [Entomospira culicis]WDI39398.1 FeoA family protein [Entomospira culicis]
MAQSTVLVKLADLQKSDQARIIGYEHSDDVALHRLLTLGLTKDEIVTVKQVAPMGDPVKVGVRGFNLSLRKDEAQALILTKI